MLAGQEHRLLSPACQTVEASMWEEGWRVAFAAARPTEAGGSLGTSAGTLVAAPSHIDMQIQFPCEGWDISPSSGKGRVTVAWIALANGRGLTVLSAYFWHSEGWSQRNQDLMWAIIRLVRQLAGGLWALSADYNMEPELLEAHPLFSELGGECVAPDRGTCRSGSTWRKYDYFIVSKPLRCLIEELRVLDEVAPTPHIPVALKVRTAPPAMYRWVCRAPRRLSTDPPIGCAPVPPAWPDLPAALESPEKATATWETLATLSEQEVLDRHFLSGKERQLHSGYAAVPSWVRKPILPPRQRPRRFSLSSQLWRSTARRLSEIWTLLYSHVYLPYRGRSSLPSESAMKQLTSVRQVLLALAAQLRAIDDDDCLSGSWCQRLGASALCIPRSGHELIAIYSWCMEASGIASKLERVDAARSDAAYRSVVSLASAAQASWLHRLSKDKVTWQSLRPTEVNNLYTPVDAAADQLQQWSTVWRVGEPVQQLTRPWEKAFVESAEDAGLALFSVPAFDAACARFRWRTGLGSDYFHPRQWRLLSDAGKSHMVSFLNLVEESGQWPAHTRYIFFHLIPKLSGGLRTIGVLAALVRLWEALRAEDFACWMQRHSREYDWACRGRSPEAAVWRQLLFAETLDPAADALTDKAHVTVLLDIVKCFERLTLHQAWYWGRRAGLPVRFLRLVLTVFSFTRTLVAQGSASDFVSSVGAIVAGSRFSCALLHLALIGPCDTLLAKWPSLDLTKFVDDLALALFATIGYIIDTLPALLTCLFELLAELGLDPSLDVDGKRGKTVVLVSHGALREALAPVVVPMGLHFDGRARNLGVDHHAAGKPSERSVRSGRQVALKRRATKLLHLKGKGGAVRKVFKTGLKPATLYGAKCLGLPASDVTHFRRVASACLPGSHRGCSTTLRLAVHKFEQQHDLLVPPLHQWAMAVWDGSIDAEVLAQAWRRQLPRIFLATELPAVHGPAAATAAAAKRVGWTWPSHRVFITKQGLRIDMCTVCPADVHAMFLYDSDAALWQSWCASDPLYTALAPRPLVEPIASFASGGAGKDGGRYMATSSVIRGSRTQAVLHEQGTAGDP